MPVLMRVFPQGLENHDPEKFRTLRLAYEEWEANNHERRPQPSPIYCESMSRRISNIYPRGLGWRNWRGRCARFSTPTAARQLLELDADSAQHRAREIEQELRHRISPSALWSITRARTEDPHYYVVDVPAGPDRPYTADGAIYVRRGSKSRPAEVGELRDLVEGSFSGSERWERRLIPSGDIDRLDTDLIIETAEQGRRRRNFPFSDPASVTSILSDLALYREGAITQAAEVLFGRRPALQFPQVRARVTVYASDKGGDFVDSRQFEGAAFPMLEQVFAMIRQHTPIAATFRDGLQRSDQPALPGGGRAGRPGECVCPPRLCELQRRPVGGPVPGKIGHLELRPATARHSDRRP